MLFEQHMNVSLKFACSFPANYRFETSAFLEVYKYFEESFRAFEKGFTLFSFPHALPIWKKCI